MLSQITVLALLNIVLLLSTGADAFFVPPAATKIVSSTSSSVLKMSSMSTNLIEPSQRNTQYGSNMAQYLIDLHDAKGTFDFCGGMMFQLVLTPKLYEHLTQVANNSNNSNNDNADTKNKQPVVFDATKSRMFQTPGYTKSGQADNVTTFHGRELRNIPQATGGFGFVLQLSMAGGEDDAEGWSKEEINTYDGWGHDSGRQWRKRQDYMNEGFVNFEERFGNDSTKAFGLNHRFYLHLDREDKIWLAAEDGCEGTPAQVSGGNPISRLFGL